MKTEISVSVLLTIAISLLTMGISSINQGDQLTGIVCIVVGFGLTVCTIILFEKGVIERVKR